MFVTVVARDSRRRRYARRQPREVRREQILDATVSLIAEHGWSGMAMERVAERTGVAKSVSYAIFESQAGLQRAVMQRAQDVTSDRVARSLAAAGDADGLVASLTAGLGVYLESVAREPEISKLVLLPIDGAPDSVRDAIHKGRERVRREIAMVVEQRLLCAGIEGLDADLIAHLVRDNAEHLARLLLEHPQKFTPQRLAGSVAAIAEAVATR
jgi:AcrR family transcriptional regulator